MPADKTEYGDGGGKVIEIEDGGDHYLLSSKVGKSASHSFVKNGMELNDGGTITVQKELIERELRYTANLHQLLTGKLSFCNMSPNQRKALIMDISGLDLTYVLDVFDKVKSLHRDTLGAHKHVGVKLTDIGTRLATVENTDWLEPKAVELEHGINKLLPHTNRSAGTLATAEYDFKQRVAALSNHLDGAKSVYDSLTRACKNASVKPSATNLDAVIDGQKTAELDLQVLKSKEATLKNSLAEHEQLTKKLADAPDNEGVEEIKKEIAELRDKIHIVLPDNPFPDHTAKALEELLVVHQALYHLGSTIPSDFRVFSADERSNIDSMVETTAKQVLGLEKELDRAKDRLHHSELARDGDVTCPNCSTRIHAPMSLTDEKYDALVKNIAILELDLLDANKVLAEWKAKQKEAGIYSRLVDDVRKIRVRTTYIQSMWTELSTPDAILLNVTGASAAVRSTYATVEAHVKRNEAIERNIHLCELLSLHELAGESNVAGKYAQLENELAELYAERDYVLTCGRELSGVISKYRQFVEFVDKAESMAEDISIGFKQMANTHGWESINNEVSDCQLQLGRIRTTIAEYKSLSDRLAELEADDAMLLRKRKGYEELAKALSPKHGLIGQQLRSVIGAFTDSINEIINSVWEYELKVVPPMGNTALDFKFPISVDGKLGPDIKEASSGQGDIIDLAVKRIIMAYKDLEDYPLFLDEVGASFDYTHRMKLMEYIRRLIAGGQCSQMFLIQHYSSEYGGLSNSDIVVLNPNNIIVPTEYNKNVTMS